jgi:hypothetical protein
MPKVHCLMSGLNARVKDAHLFLQRIELTEQLMMTTPFLAHYYSHSLDRNGRPMRGVLSQQIHDELHHDHEECIKDIQSSLQNLGANMGTCESTWLS